MLSSAEMIIVFSAWLPGGADDVPGLCGIVFKSCLASSGKLKPLVSFLAERCVDGSASGEIGGKDEDCSTSPCSGSNC